MTNNFNGQDFRQRLFADRQPLKMNRNANTSKTKMSKDIAHNKDIFNTTSLFKNATNRETDC